MAKITITDRLRYSFDNFMSKGTIALIIGLGSVSFLFFLLISAIIIWTHALPQQEDTSFPEAMWDIFIHSIDTGTLANDQSWKLRLIMLLVTFTGLFSMGTLIGIITNGVEEKLADLRKGRSRVIETDHIVILGWSLQVFTLISELAIADANNPDTCIVVLSEKEKHDMEDSLRDELGKISRIRIVCRRGSHSNMSDLGMVNIQASRSIIVVNTFNDNQDICLIKTLLAITNIPRSVSHPYHIVVQVQNPKNVEVIKVIGGNQVEIVLINNLIARIIIQTSRQSGLSFVYETLLDFQSSNEIYLKEEPSLENKTYGNALLAYNNSCVIGIKRADGKIQLNPPINTKLKTTEKLVFISKDYHSIALGPNTDHGIEWKAIINLKLRPSGAENTLILGWNNYVPFMIQQMDQYVQLGSMITVVNDFPFVEKILNSKSLGIQKQTLQYVQADITRRKTLEELHLAQYNQIIILCNTDIESELADSHTLVTLVHLRDIANRNNYKFKLVTEIMDVKNRTLAQAAKADDFVVSEQIISLAVAQIAINKDLNDVFTDVFNPEGSEIYLKPVNNYVNIAQWINFYTVVESAKQYGESAIGYLSQADANNMAKSYGIVINPQKDQMINFTHQDRIIVLAEN